jgi:hypothetical protein
MNEGQVAQGWYQDPYAIHKHRYFSAGCQPSSFAMASTSLMIRPRMAPFLTASLFQ